MVHNLREMAWEDTAYDWALEFDARMKELILAGDHKAIIHYSKLGRSARLAVPTAEHYLLLLYVLGAQNEAEGVAFFADKVTLGSMSMRSVRIGRFRRAAITGQSHIDCKDRRSLRPTPFVSQRGRNLCTSSGCGETLLTSARAAALARFSCGAPHSRSPEACPNRSVL